MDITREEKLVNFDHLLSIYCLPNAPCFFLTGLWLVHSSHFLLLATSLVVIASSMFIYFWALWSSFAIVFDGLLVIEKKKRNLQVTILLKRLSRWPNPSLCPPAAILYWNMSRIASMTLLLPDGCWEDAELTSCVIVLQWNDEWKPYWDARSLQWYLGVFCRTIPWLHPSALLGKPCTLLHPGSSAKASKFWMSQCGLKDLLNRQMAPAGEDETPMGKDDSTPQWWMVSQSFKSFHLGFPQLYPSLHSWVHPFPFSSYEVHSPSWTSFLPTSSPSC